MGIDTVSTPECFGQPDRVEACYRCGVRMRCYLAQAEDSPILLLPFDAPAPQRTSPSVNNVVPDWPESEYLR